MRDALIAAATRLFCEQGPRATSLREVAAAAGVNHGLIHRHFGSKRALVRAVYQHLVERLAATGPFDEPTLGGALGAFHALEDNREFWIVLTRATLDGELEDVLASGLPGGHRMVDAVEQSLGADAPLAAREVVAMSFAFSLGWLLLRDFIQAATDAPDDLPTTWFEAMARLLEAQ